MPEPAATTDILDVGIEEVFTPPGEGRRTHYFGGLIASSEIMLGLFELLKRVADSDSTLLVSGESGTGKEVVAKGLHVNSPRCNGPFIPVHCGAIPDTLLESELFGHEKGAFPATPSISLPATQDSYPLLHLKI